ncbi:MAG: MlaD family protein [Paludibacteraceae bacterium]|nr:MlaD family protein [Paludibacteraceae bacterium]
MKINQEFKIGIAFIAALVILIIGVNFLKGVNLFTPANHFYTTYEKVDGLVVSNAVYVKGFKVGQVKNIKYDFSKEVPFTVEISINKDVKLPEGTKMLMRDDGLLGGKVIDLVMPENGSNYLANGASLESEIATGLMDALGGMVPQLESTLAKLDSTMGAINELVHSDRIDNMLASLDTTTSNLKQSSVKLKSIMNNDVPHLLTNVNGIASDVKVVTTNLKDADFAAIIAKADSTITSVDKFVEQLNNSDGTLGALLNDRTLYNKVNNTVQSADNLLIDLKANPKRYVHFSVFGGKDKKEKKADNK